MDLQERRRDLTLRSVGGLERGTAKWMFQACAALGLSTGEPIDHRFGRRLEWRIIHRYLGLTGQESVCDVGCGDGNWTRRLHGESGMTVGVDLNWRVARWAAVKTRVHEMRGGPRIRRFRGLPATVWRVVRQQTAREGRESIDSEMFSRHLRTSQNKATTPRPIFVCSDAQRLPFASGTFDRVSSICSLEHFIDDGQALREMARVLKPGGIAALTMDSLSHPHGLSGPLMEQYRRRHRIRHSYRLSDVEQMALDNGFVVEESRYVVSSRFSNYLHLSWAKWDLQGVHANLIEALFPFLYPLALLSDSLFGLPDSGAVLAVKLRRTNLLAA